MITEGEVRVTETGAVWILKEAAEPLGLPLAQTHPSEQAKAG